MKGVYVGSNKFEFYWYNPVFRAVLAGIEFLVIKIIGNRQFILGAGNPQKHAGNLIYIGHFVVYLILIAASLVLINAYWSDRHKIEEELSAYAPSKLLIHLNLSSFLILSALILVNRTYYNGALAPIYTWAIFSALPFKFVLMCTLPLLIAPIDAWSLYFKKYFTLPVKSLLLLLLILSPNDKSIAMYVGSHLILPTIGIAQYLYRLGGGEIKVTMFDDEGYPVISDNTFTVVVRPTCSGYEGITLILLFLILFLPLLSKAYTQTQVYLIGVVCLAATFFMNSLRIALMMYIGEHVSEKVAVNGFHTHFGILSLLTIACICMAFVAKRQSVFRTGSRDSYSNPEPILDEEYDFILLLPLVVTLGSSIIMGLFEDGFNWFYPGPIMLGSLALMIVRNKLDLKLARVKIGPLFVGIIVFMIWIYLIPINSDYENMFEKNLYRYGSLQASLWLFVRVMGSSFFIPIVEEIVFRGVLWDYIGDLTKKIKNNGAGQIVVMLTTSTSFAFLHSDVLAAFIAGIAYGLLRFLGYGVYGSIIAHIVTNSLISFYVIFFSRWSYW